jgi:hypothetical protein
MGSRADEVDAFLEPGLRNHRASDDDFDEHAADGQGGTVRALYQRMIARSGPVPYGAAKVG